MRNAIGTADKNPLPTWPECPWWCKEHEDTDVVRGVGHGFRLHKGVELSTDVASARLTRADMLGEGVGDVTVLLDDRDLTPEEARVLSTMLAVLVNDSARPAADQ